MSLAAVVIDGVEIPEKLIAEEAQHHPSATITQARAEAARALAIRALLLQRARLLGLEAEPELDALGRSETDEEALIRAVLAHEISVDPPGEEACRAVYQRDRERFRAPGLYTASHILVSPGSEAPDAWERAREKADALSARLRADPAAFEALAVAHSACPSSAQGGALGQMRRGDLVAEVEQALDALQAGDIAPAPVKSRFGWHILRLDRRAEGDLLPYEHVEPHIRSNLENRAWAEAAAGYVAGLASQARDSGVALSLREDGHVASGPASLGDFLSDADGVALRLETWLEAVDPNLAETVRDAASQAAKTVSAFVRAEVAAFVETGDDEAWTRLISAARDADDPALAAARIILQRRLTPARRTHALVRRR